MNENEQSKTPVTIWNMMKRTNKMLDNCKQADTQTDIYGRKHNASEKTATQMSEEEREVVRESELNNNSKYAKCCNFAL